LKELSGASNHVTVSVGGAPIAILQQHIESWRAVSHGPEGPGTPGALAVTDSPPRGRGHALFLGFFRVVASFLAGEDLLGDQAGVLPDCRFDAGSDVGIVAQERFCVLAALADALAVV
jgi:hypothetical protein